MKILILSIIISFSVVGYSQSKATLIQNIRKEFQQINNTKGYQIISLDAEEFLEQAPDGGGELKGYFKNDTLKKIVVSVGISNGMESREFYFKNNQLIFVFEKFDSYVYTEKKKELDYTKTERSFEGRYYFNKGKLIDHISMGHNRFEDDSLDPEKVLLGEANDYIELLDKKKTKAHKSNRAG
jgi:hypothetical protein